MDFSCEDCGKQFPTKRTLSQHCKRGHKDFPCDICLTSAFTTKSDWEEHRKIHFNVSEVRANRSVLGASSVDTHIESHEVTSAIKVSENIGNIVGPRRQCLFCNLKLSSDQQFKLHIKHEHRDMLAYECICGNVFIGRREFSIHKFSCPQNEKYVCEICDNVFATKQSILNHKAEHITPIPSIIVHQQQETTAESVFQPQLIYQGKSPSNFMCKVCQETFSNLVDLKSHQKTKNKCEAKPPIIDKPFKCLCCKKEYYLEGSLKLHQINCSQECYYVDGTMKSFCWNDVVQDRANFVMALL